MATRQATPDILGNVLGPVVDDTAIIRQQLRYDYSLIPADQRTQVQAAAVDIVQAGRQAQESLLSVGQRLTEVKGMLEHGQFSDWCAAEFDMSQRTAQRMMQVAKAFAGKNDKLSLLSDSAMYMLAAPSTPEAARIEVLERVEATGQKPSVSEVKATINRHKPTPTPVKVTRIDDAAEDAWRPPGIGARVMQQQVEAPQYPHPLPEVEAVRQAQAAAAAGVAFGMAPPRHAELVRILDAAMEALPEIGDLITQRQYCLSVVTTLGIMRKELLRAVAEADATSAPVLPTYLADAGWQLHQLRGKWFADVRVPTEQEPIKTQLRADVADTIRDAQYLHKSLRIGA